MPASQRIVAERFCEPFAESWSRHSSGADRNTQQVTLLFALRLDAQGHFRRLIEGAGGVCCGPGWKAEEAGCKPGCRNDGNAGQLVTKIASEPTGEPLSNPVSGLRPKAHRDRWQVVQKRTTRIVFQVATEAASRAIPGPRLDRRQARTQDRTKKLRR
jgi:hypothetical protein